MAIDITAQREPDPGVSCAVLHKDRDGNTIPCPDRRGSPVQRPPARLYEVRTVHGEIYQAEGDVIEQGDGWFTLWGDAMTVALRLPEADVRSVRHITEGEAEASIDSAANCRPGCCVDNDSFAPTTCSFCGSRKDCVNHPGPDALARGVPGHLFSPSGPGDDAPLAEAPCPDFSYERPHDAHEWDAPVDGHVSCPGWGAPDSENQEDGASAEELRNRVDEARMWARHGYEIGQRHCGWTDHGVAPTWLTEGWPRHFDSCEHLKQAADFDTALTRVRALHRPAEHRGVTICAECSAWDGETTDNAPVAHPCATIRALDGDTTSKEQQA